ncbi:MAG: hypothetical protein HZT40_01060 [Candidatus Thiothrix singaporensis]|uniref:Uncharacterized protein n=1 Tax=Candidatus Thiothrix singaporensis TaxID=2799669 RepID=A0A7L6AMT3_9GAMM|nr:MAG: hypothetical protein HZT40_01060 [Candidatus Thiothrix singaporensis]
MNVLHKPSNTLLVCTITCSLVGCGGGGSDSSTAQDNSSPAQSAGVDLQQAIAGGVYLDSTGKRMLAFDGSGNGTVYTNTPDVNSDKKYKAAAITWSIDGVNLTVATSTGQEILQASADGGMLTTTGNPASYTKTKPLSVALLDGKHLSEIIATGNECTARTLSFSGSTLTVREACGGAFNQIDLAMEQVSGLQGVIQATGSFGGYGLSYQIALQDGDVSKQSTLVIRAVREGRSPTHHPTRSWTAR